MKKKIFRSLPKFLQTELTRRSLDVSKTLDENIQFKVAETVPELEQALRLVHDAYVREGFISPHPSGLRVIPQHQLESTYVLIAKVGDEVVATLTLVRNGKVDLPLERAFDLSSIRQSGKRIAEITCLTVKSEYRRAQGGAIFANLMKYMYEFSIGYAGVDQLVIAVFPKDAVFYEGLLRFCPLDRKPVDYLGAPAIALCLNLQTFPTRIKKVYNWRSEKNNLYRFFIQKKVSNFQFPNRLFCEINYPTLSVDFAKTFFAKQEPSNVRAIWSSSKNLRDPRLEVSCPGEWSVNPFQKKSPLQVLDASGQGMKIHSTETLYMGRTYTASLQISPKHRCQVTITVQWTDSHGIYGLMVREAEPLWSDFVASVLLRSHSTASSLKVAG